MSFYSILFLLSTVGMLIIARRNKVLFYESNFAQFMGVLRDETANLWHIHLRERSFVALENTLRAIRIWFVRMEMSMLRALNHVRGIKEKNGSSGNTETEE